MSLSSAALLRYASALFDSCPKGWTDDYSAAELLAIAGAGLASGWDYLPHTWEPRQIREATAGVTPRWSADGKRAEYGTEEEQTAPLPDAARLDGAIDTYADRLCDIHDRAAMAGLAAALDVLLRYRADAEARVARRGDGR